MYTWSEQTTCPHCGRVLRLGSCSVAHERVCVKDPAIFAATRAALDDGEGKIRSMADYDADRRGGVSRKSLLKQTGWSWRDVAKHFGLDPSPDARSTRAAQKEIWERVGAEIDAQMAANHALRFSCGRFRM